MSGCTNIEELNQKTRCEYMSLNCEQLNHEYYTLSDKKQREFDSRMTMNGVNTVIGVIGLINGSGTIRYNQETDEEREYERRLQILREILAEKKCNNCADTNEQNKSENVPTPENNQKSEAEVQATS